MNFDDIKKEIEIKKAPLEKVELNKTDNHIITNKSSVKADFSKYELYSTANEILISMTNKIQNDINLVDVLKSEMKDPLLKYQDKDKNISITDIPDNIYIVAIVYKLIQVSKTQGWNIAKEDDFIYLYNGGYWIQCFKNELYNFFNSIAKRMNFYSTARAETHRFKDDLYKQFLASAEFYKAFKRDDTVLLNCLNGTLEVTQNKIELRKHNKDDFLKYVLNFNFDSTATAPIFKQYLDDVLGIDTQIVLQEFAGYIFVNHLKLEKSLILYGSGANGKSVFFEVIKALLGNSNISMMSLGDLTDKSSGEANRALLKDKLVNYGSEIRGQNIDIDIFKRLVSGEPVQARLKYGNPFMLESNTKLIFNANELPNLNEHNEAIFRRFIIIPFEKTISKEKRDSELHSKIINNELSGVLNWILEGLERLLKNKDFSDSKKTNEAIEDYKKESDNVALFIEEHNYQITDIEEYFISIADLYDEYKTTTKENGKHPLGKNKFSTRLKNLGFIQMSKTIHSKTAKGYLIKPL